MRVSLPADGKWSFGNPTGAGRQPFSLQLAKLDVPHPATPEGGPAGRKLILTSAAVEQFGPTMFGMPARMALTGNSHYDAMSPNPDGTPRKGKARALGVAMNSSVKDVGGDKFWVVDGFWWPQENPALAAELQTKQDEYGGSYEIRVTGQHETPDAVYIDSFECEGLALLTRASAAFQDQTKLLYAEAVGPSWDRLDGDMQDALVDEMAAIVTLLAQAADLPLAPPEMAWDGNAAAKDMLDACTNADGMVDGTQAHRGFAVLRGDPKLRGSWHLPFAARIDGTLKVVRQGVLAALAALNPNSGRAIQGLSDAERTATERFLRRQLARFGETKAESGPPEESGAAGTDGAAEPPKGEPMETQEILDRLGALERERGLQAAQIEALTAEKTTVAKEQEAVAAVLKAAGVESVDALVSRLVTATADSESLKLAHAEELKTAQETIDGLRAQVVASQTDTLLAELKAGGRVDDKNEAAVKIVCAKQAKGEALAADEFRLLASLSAATPATPVIPRGTAINAEAGGEDPDLLVKLGRQAAELVKAGTIRAVERDRWINGQLTGGGK